MIIEKTINIKGRNSNNMITTLKTAFNLWDLKDIFHALLNILISCQTYSKEFLKVNFSLLISCKENFTANKFMQELLKTELIEYCLKEIDLKNLYDELLKSDELNNKDLRFIDYLGLFITNPEYFEGISFHLFLDEHTKNVYTIRTNGMSFAFNEKTTKHSYQELIKDKERITFIFANIFYQNSDESKIEKFSDTISYKLRNYFNNLLVSQFEEGTAGNFISEYSKRYDEETLFFITK